MLINSEEIKSAHGKKNHEGMFSSVLGSCEICVVLLFSQQQRLLFIFSPRIVLITSSRNQAELEGLRS